MNTTTTAKFGMGASVLRLEDHALVTGAGDFTDDTSLPGMLHGYVLRAPCANARILSVDASAAKAMAGVHLVLTGGDVAHLGALRSDSMRKQPDGTLAPTRDIPILCSGHVRHVGDAVAFIVAESRQLAQDAAEQIEVAYEDLPAAIGTDAALAPDAPLVWPELGSNRAFFTRLGDRAATDAAFAGAGRTTRIDIVNNRLVANYLETRSAIGQWDGERFTLTTGSQGVHSMRKILAEKVFAMPREAFRVVTGDVGGGFGTKNFVYREHALVLEAARRLSRPVKWSADRVEHFLVDSQGRDNVTTAEMAMDEHGRFLALRVHVRANMGAYIHQFGAYIPGAGATMGTGLYDIPTMCYEVTGVYTNSCPTDAYRGAGRPEAAFMIEQLVDACGREMGLSADEIRRRNFIRPDQLPYRTAGGRTYDVGEFEQHMDLAMERAGWHGFEQRRAAAAARGRLAGIGMACYVEACAFAGSEPAHAELAEDGTVTLLIGTQSNGQGHATAYAQLVAEKLDIEVSRVRVHQGDTDRLARGGGTGGSRSLPLGGVSAAMAGEELANKIRRIAARELEAAPEDIELAAGLARIVGTDRHLDLKSVARAARSIEERSAIGEYVQDDATFPNGTHIAEAEIDPETGAVEIVAYTIVDDFGAVVNPLLLQGQVHGGVAQGIGQALMEDAVYGADGQLLTASFMDYAMPRASDLPDFRFETRNVPSTTNALGMKGAGEAGTVAATPALKNAIDDALWHGRGIAPIDMPATPLRIWQAIEGAGREAALARKQN